MFCERRVLFFLLFSFVYFLMIQLFLRLLVEIGACFSILQPLIDTGWIFSSIAIFLFFASSFVSDIVCPFVDNILCWSRLSFRFHAIYFDFFKVLLLFFILFHFVSAHSHNHPHAACPMFRIICHNCVTLFQTTVKCGFNIRLTLVCICQSRK